MKIEKGMEEKGEKERKRGAKERRERRENYFKELHLKRSVSELDNVNILNIYIYFKIFLFPLFCF